VQGRSTAQDQRRNVAPESTIAFAKAPTSAASMSRSCVVKTTRAIGNEDASHLAYDLFRPQEVRDSEVRNRGAKRSACEGKFFRHRHRQTITSGWRPQSRRNIPWVMSSATTSRIGANLRS
jgi:hypothetical protein